MKQLWIAALAALAFAAHVAQAQTMAPEKSAPLKKTPPAAAPSAEPSRPTAQQVFFQAFEHLRAGRVDEAVAGFRAGLELEPHSAQAWYFLGEALRTKNDLEGARAAYAEAMKRGASEPGENARKRIAELPAKTYPKPALPAPDQASAVGSLRRAGQLVQKPLQAPFTYQLTDTLLLAAEAQIHAGDAEGARWLLGALAAAIPERQAMFAKADSAHARSYQARSLARVAWLQSRADAAAAGRAARGRIGVVIQQEFTGERAASLGLDRPRGALVDSVPKGMPADRAGIEPNDVILVFDGKPVERSSDLPGIVGSTRPGSKVAVEVWRKRQRHQLTLTVEQLQEERVDSPAAAQTARRAEAAAEAVMDASSDASLDREKAADAFAHVAFFAYLKLQDIDSANRAYRRALAEVQANDEGNRSDRYAGIAVIRVQAGDVQGAMSMEKMIKARHPKFYVGHSWHRVALAMALPLAREGRYQEAARIAARTDEEDPYFASTNLQKLVKIALDKGDVREAEELAVATFADAVRAESLAEVARAYAVRNDWRGAERMLDRLRGIRNSESARLQPMLLAALGREQEACAAAARLQDDYDRKAAQQALVEGIGLRGEFAKAQELFASLESYRQSNAFVTVTMAAAWREPAAAETLAKLKQFHFVLSEVVRARVRAWDFEGARRLVEAAGGSTELRKALAYELAEQGYWNEAMKHAEALKEDLEFWARVGRAQTGLPWVSLFKESP